MPGAKIIDLKKTFYFQHIENKSLKKILPIGILPGYNSNIDDINFSFSKDLLHNFTFTDLQPVSYDLKMLEGIMETFNAAGLKWDILFKKSTMTEKEYEQALKAFKEYKDKFKGALYEYNEASTNTVNKVVVDALRQNLGDFINLNEIPVLRLIGSQDSVYSETLQNRFGDNNLMAEIEQSPLGMIVSPIASVKNMIQSSGKKGLVGSAISSTLDLIKTFPKYNYDLGLKLMKEFSYSTSLADLFKKELLGLQISLPRVFEGSNYSESLNIFIRLTSPTGHDDDIRSYILIPILLLLTAGAPISYDNITYGFPPLWKIMSYGNAYQTVGVIDVITISRGSMETTYSDNLMPLSVDVRLTLTSLNHHYIPVLLDKNHFS